MSKLISLALTIVILATVAIAEPNQPVITEVQQRSDFVPAAESQQGEADQLEIYRLLDNKIIGLEKQIRQTKEEIDKKLDYQMRCNDAALNSVNTSISGDSYALMLFGIIATLLGVALGLYITRQVKNVTHIAKQSKIVLGDHLKIRDEVRDLDEKIKTNMSELYNALKEEETKALVERLCEVPEDIGNLFDVLASRYISKEFFPQMKKAYQSLSDVSDGSGYILLFFQHFPSLAIFDEDLQGKFEAGYGMLMDGSFKNDILKTSEEFIKVTIKEGNILHFSEKIKKYFIALGQSKFKKYLELHKHLYNILATKENRFNLYSIFQQEAQLKETAKIYGRFLLDDYKNASGNTGAEVKILTNLAEAEAIEIKSEGSEPEPAK